MQKGIEIPNEVLAKCIHTTTEMYFDLVFLLITSFITTRNSDQALIHHIFFTEWFFLLKQKQTKSLTRQKSSTIIAQSSHLLKSKVARKGMKIFRCYCTFRRRKPNYKGCKCLGHDSTERHFLDIKVE